MMKKMIKTGISIVVAVGMLAMSVPTFAFAEETADTIVIDPNELLSKDDLPEGEGVSGMVGYQGRRGGGSVAQRAEYPYHLFAGHRAFSQGRPLDLRTVIHQRR